MSFVGIAEGDLDAKWTFDSGGNVSSQFASDWGGVLVASGSDDDAEEWNGAVCVSNNEDSEDFTLRPVSKEEEKKPEPAVEKKKAKVQLELASPKLSGISEEEAPDSPVTTSTYRDSFSSRGSSNYAPPPPPKSPVAQNVMSPMQRARLALSKKAITQSARSEHKASVRMKMESLGAFTSLDMDDMFK
mmetsp:Transcript_2924/g.6887  ORF Transcript_2924/g.6887 Transcript_2924/m.6887 type:complete len:188 (-) Transcript_2924:256-819(-)|eukprot:CAMPEP_0113632970 /NCGR_PEP_ID=MMETSP0017_2-20120614/17146_1 /TAXON_ID=2856 /ORGANISM="Cylindrotheca closterium" /LENGTH=187 /DNA_ID=CAMNT_0000543565 /DNA_START=17 /DNA_END=580 /DNA_ORIENTATION=+ /assembly_acc=CAM_ASM_000147